MTSGQTYCSGKRVDVTSDAGNCGACGNVCPSGADIGCCGGNCVDLPGDSKNNSREHDDARAEGGVTG